MPNSFDCPTYPVLYSDGRFISFTYWSIADVILVDDPPGLVFASSVTCRCRFVRSTELGEGKREALRRLDRLTAELGLDRERALGWTIVQTAAWSGGSDYIEEHMEIAHGLLEDA